MPLKDIKDIKVVQIATRVPAELRRDIRLLAAVRDTNVNDLYRGILEAEVERARAAGELPREDR